VGRRQPSVGLLGEDRLVSRLGRLGAAVVLVAAGLVGCSVGDRVSDGPEDDATSPDATTATPEPSATGGTGAGGQVTAEPPPRPETGTCYRLDADAAVAPTNEAEPVRCRSPHTALTWHVGTLDAVVDGHLLAVDSARVQEQVARACPRRLPGFVGATPRELRLSMVRAVWFSPTVEQAANGADWYRCDVVALAKDGELAPLRRPMKGALSGDRGFDRFAVCGTARPGSEGFERVICSRKHAWRATASYDIPGRTWPGQQRLRQIGSDPCRSAGEAAANSSLDFEWALDWPDREQWRAGRRYGLCWAPD
jgi:hypothetical protein